MAESSPLILEVGGKVEAVPVEREFEGTIVAVWPRLCDGTVLVAVEDVTGVTRLFSPDVLRGIDRPLRDLRRERRSREREIEKLARGTEEQG